MDPTLPVAITATTTANAAMNRTWCRSVTVAVSAVRGFGDNGRMRRRALVATAALLLAACTSGVDERPAPAPSTTAANRVPVSWPTADATEAGFDAKALARIDRHLEKSGSSCFVVVHDGAVVHEQYWNGGEPTLARAAFSVTKSFTSVLVGIAADQGLLDLDDRVSQYVPQWKGTASADVTIRDLLSNTSGRQWDFESDYNKMAFAEPDKTAFAIGLSQQHPRGTTWTYNNSAIQVLSAVLRAATGEEPAEIAQREILDPLRMTDTTWSNDQAGHTMTFAGVSSTCLDLARFGQMALGEGQWDGTRVVSRSYLDEATQQSSSDLNAAYGLLWWVNQPGIVLGALQATDPERRPSTDDTGRLAPRVPDDAFWALGLGSQVVAVVPSERLVAVRMGVQPTSSRAVSPDRFTGDLLDALKR